MQYYQNPYVAMSPCMQQHPFMQTQAMMPELALVSQTAPRRTQDIYTYPYNYQDALELIREAVAGEAEDRLFYDYLIKTAPSEEDKEIIKGIRDDEINHFALFKQVYYELTGRALQPNQEVDFNQPESHCDGIREAIKGEQSSVIKYRKILYAMQDRRHINMLTEIITDELRHGTLYNYLYSKNNCKA